MTIRKTLLLAMMAGLASACAHAAALRDPQATPEAALGEFLRLSLVSTPRHAGMFEGTWTCLPEEMGARFDWLGDYRVLSSRMVGDTAVVSAEVLVVAHQEESAHAQYGWRATREMRTDTLSWNLLGPTPSGPWTVCGISREGVDFSTVGRPERFLWDPPGTTWAQMIQFVDSIQRARHPRP